MYYGDRKMLDQYDDRIDTLTRGFLGLTPDSTPPAPGLSALTSWHHHDNLCFDRVTGQIVAFAHSGTADTNEKDKSGVCPRGSSNHSTPEMLHVWVVDNPSGPFDADMDPDALKALIPL